MTDQRRLFAVSALLGASAAWPNAICLLSQATMTPLERALRSSWCGDMQALAQTHGAACWIGAGLLALAAGAIALQPRIRHLPVRARYAS